MICPIYWILIFWEYCYFRLHYIRVKKKLWSRKLPFKKGRTFVIRRIHRSQLNTHQNDWTLTGFIFLLSIFIKLSENEGSVRCWGSFCKDHYNFVFYANATSAFYLNVMGKNYDSSSFVLEQQKDSSLKWFMFIH